MFVTNPSHSNYGTSVKGESIVWRATEHGEHQRRLRNGHSDGTCNLGDDGAAVVHSKSAVKYQLPSRRETQPGAIALALKSLKNARYLDGGPLALSARGRNALLVEAGCDGPKARCASRL